MAKAAQEAAVKAAMEQAQSMFGNIPGFQMPEGIQEQVMAQMTAGIPNMAEMQAQQEAMLKAAGIDMETVAEAGRQNMTFAQQMMQNFYDLGDPDEGWSIHRSGEGKLDAGQLRLLAFGVPMLVYNDENVDTIDCESDIDSIKCTLREWWNVTDRKSTLDIVRWLLEEGHHAEADRILAEIRERGLENIPAKERCSKGGKMEDVCLIAEEMQRNNWCPAGKMPQSAIAWDLVRVVNLGRWAYLCGYISENEMWQTMQVAADTALEHFSSWEEYGWSFILGRGVWQGDPADSETADEIIKLLLENGESPWKQSSWEA